MNRQRILDIHTKLCADARALLTPKGNTYASEDDALSNFHRTAERYKVTLLQAVGVHKDKQDIALANIMGGGEDTDGLHSRLLDIINYCVFALAVTLDKDDDYQQLGDLMEGGEHPLNEVYNLTLAALRMADASTEEYAVIKRALKNLRGEHPLKEAFDCHAAKLTESIKKGVDYTVLYGQPHEADNVPPIATMTVPDCPLCHCGVLYYQEVAGMKVKFRCAECGHEFLTPLTGDWISCND